LINTKRLLKVSVVWISVVYVVCFAVVAMFPGIRESFMLYSFHTRVNMGTNVLTFGTFIYGLIFWNVIAILAVGFFSKLYNAVKE